MTHKIVDSREDDVRRLREMDEEFKVKDAVVGGVGYYRLECSFKGGPGRRVSDGFAELMGDRANPPYVEQTHGRISLRESDISAFASSCWYFAAIGEKATSL